MQLSYHQLKAKLRFLRDSYQIKLRVKLNAPYEALEDERIRVMDELVRKHNSELALTKH
jgi:hypothetical protein